MSHYIILGGSGDDSVPVALARSLISKSHEVTILTRDPVRINFDHKNLSKIQCDVTDASHLSNVIEHAAHIQNGIDGIVYSACYVQRSSPLDTQSATKDEWLKSFEINVIGAHLAVDYARPWLKKSNGCVLLYGSRAGEDYDYGTSITFAVSKSALHSLTKVLSYALGPEIRVNGLIMGFLPTNRIRNYVDDSTISKRLQRWVEDSALNRSVTMKDVIDASIMLLENNSMTGQILRVDAGRSVGSNG